MNYKNYELDFLGHSVVTVDEKGIIVETALPFRKYIGMKIDDVEHELSKRKSFKGLKDLGTTKDSRLINKGDST